MMLGGLPFVLYVRLVTKGSFNILHDDQVKVYLGILSIVTLALVLYLVMNDHMALEYSVVAALFNVVSVVTTTGYATTDYTLWGAFPLVVFFFITYLGGCAGSTAGGAKTMRLIVGYQVFKLQMLKLIS
ncbi:MAG: potassium transporter TrkH, partial [Phototrophicales bacterium]